MYYSKQFTSEDKTETLKMITKSFLIELPASPVWLFKIFLNLSLRFYRSGGQRHKHSRAPRYLAVS